MRIQQADVGAVRERISIEELVGETVILRSAGSGSLKGLCPFHEERGPSFHVRPALGLWHCFGCGEGGDAIAYAQRLHGMSFVEAMQWLAGRCGLELHYQVGHEPINSRRRLLQANAVAAGYFQECLPGAREAQNFLDGRGFGGRITERFGVGFAPASGLLGHLRSRGFTEQELLDSGLAAKGKRGLHERFRDRVTWPVCEVSGEIVGFGARRLGEGEGPKYLNTPDTVIYRKSQLLYGMNLARQEIVKSRELVVVEGYTDVMACHLAGVTNAVATCGTAFGAGHVRLARRLVGDGDAGGSVTFAFDGDAAGQKAALKAFDDDQTFVAQMFLVLVPEGMDPCELRVRRGDEAVREAMARRQPMFEFAIRSMLARLDLDTAEARARGLRLGASMVGGIKDPALRPEYGRRLAGWLGVDVEDVLAAMRTPGRTRGTVTERVQPELERQALACLLQVPGLIGGDDLEFSVPAHQKMYEALKAGGELPEGASELAVLALPTDDPMAYAQGVLARMGERAAGRRTELLRSRVQRGDMSAYRQLIEMERYRRSLQEKADGP